MTLFSQKYGAGEPLIILHGLLGMLDNWHTVSRMLAESYEVIAADLRNQGRSPHSNIFSYPVMVSDVIELMDTEHIATTHIIGHSMGGKVAMTLALSSPERIRKLVVVDIAPRSYPRLHDDLLAAMMSIDPGNYESRRQVDESLKGSIPDLAVRQFLLKNLAHDSVGRLHWKANLEVISRNYDALSSEVDSPRPFRGPVLFVKGARSDYVKNSDTKNILRLFPKATIATMDAGHWVHADSPALFTEVVLKFLSE